MRDEYQLTTTGRTYYTIPIVAWVIVRRWIKPQCAAIEAIEVEAPLDGTGLAVDLSEGAEIIATVPAAPGTAKVYSYQKGTDEPHKLERYIFEPGSLKAGS